MRMLKRDDFVVVKPVASKHNFFVCATACVAGLVLLYFRAPQTFLSPQFWAEDGAVFYAGVKNSGPISVLALHAGTLHIIPRIASLIEAAFPAVNAPAINAALCVMVTCWTLATIATARLRYALVFAILCLLAPHSGEIFGSMTHIQWILAPALLVLSASPSPESRSGRANQIIFVTLAGLTGPFSTLCLPLFALKLWRERDSHAVTISTIAISTGLLQGGLSSLFYIPRTAVETAHSHFHMASSMLNGWFGILSSGQYVYTAMAMGWAFVFAIGVNCVATLKAWRYFFAAALFVAVLSLLCGILRFGNSNPTYFDFPSDGDRYFYLPRVACLWAIAVLILDGPRIHKIVGVALAILVAVNFWHWSRRLYPYLPWKEIAWKIDQGQAVKVPINPDGWKVVIFSTNGESPRDSD